jgi:ElaB/YqjD/DUF883 family membrane-anchored ribosome-binding protein
MSGKSEELINSLHRVVADLEALARSAGEAASEGGEEARGRLREALARARERVGEAEEALGAKLARGARGTDAYVRENPWASIGIAAIVAFIAGSLLGGGRRGR